MEVAGAVTSTAIAAAGAATEMAGKCEIIARLTSKNEKWEVEEQLTETQAQGVSTFFAGLLEELKTSITDQITKQMKEAMTPGKHVKEAENLASDQAVGGSTGNEPGGAADDEGFTTIAKNGKAAKLTKAEGKGPQTRGRASVTADSIIEDRTTGAKRPGDEADDAERLARCSEDVEAKGAGKGAN